MSQEIKAVLFDFDGTLVDSEPVHFEAWKAVMEPLGVTISHQVFMERFVGVEDREAVRMVAEAQTPPRTFDELWATFPRKQEIFRQMMDAHPQVPQATRTLIADLKAAGYLLGVVTSSSSVEVSPMLDRNGIRQYLDVTVFCEDVTRRKPDPEPYLKALDALGLSTALVLEDSNSGMTAATSAGCEVIRVVDVHDVADLVRSRLNLFGD